MKCCIAVAPADDRCSYCSGRDVYEQASAPQAHFTPGLERTAVIAAEQVAANTLAPNTHAEAGVISSPKWHRLMKAIHQSEPARVDGAPAQSVQQNGEHGGRLHARCR